MKNDNANIPESAGNENFNVQLMFHSISFILIPHEYDLIKTKVIKYMIDTVPRELNFVKKVGLLKFKNGNINKPRKIGTVLYRSQTGSKVLYV